jgi:histone deacetylase 6
MEPFPLLVIFHDPPSFKDHSDPMTGKGELHNTWLVSSTATSSRVMTDFGLKTDVTKRYIDWAVKNDFQVIDVNIPRVVTVEDVSCATFSSSEVVLT